jgi:predicted small secreted protein
MNKMNKMNKINKLNKIILLISLLSFTACNTLSSVGKKITPNIGECPPKEERTLTDIVCQEKK